MGASKKFGALLGSPCNKEHDALGSVLGPPNFWKLLKGARPSSHENMLPKLSGLCCAVHLEPELLEVSLRTLFMSKKQRAPLEGIWGHVFRPY